MDSKLIKGFGAGVLSGVALVAISLGGGLAIKKAMTPTEEFVDAKASVASTYAVSSDKLKLYRYDDDSIWKEVSDTTQFGTANGIYPQYVYTSVVNNAEDILAVELATPKKELLQKIEICGKPIDSYDVQYTYVTDRFEPVYLARINVAGLDDIDAVISGIDTEANR